MVDRKGQIDESSGAIDVSKLRRKLLSLSESPLSFLLLLDGQGRIRFANSDFQRFVRCDSAQLNGQSFASFFQDEEAYAAESLVENLSSACPEGEISLFVGQGRGERRFMHWKFAAVIDSGDRIAQIMVTARDIVSEQVAEHLISEQDRQLRTMMANLPGMVYRCHYDEPMMLDFVSEGALALTGYSPALLLEAPGGSYYGLIHEQDRERVRNEISRAVENRQPYHFGYRLLRRDGTWIWVREQGCAVYKLNGRVRYLEGIILDVSKEHVLEEQLQHAQKMEAVGQLAGGIAHDFNNLLQIVLSYSELLIEERIWPEEVQSSLNHIYSASLRARDLVQQLLAFGRRQLLEPVSLDLGELIARTTEMLHRLLGEAVRLNLQLGVDTHLVLADPGALEQVIVNLCLNARDAMPQGGEIAITLQRQTISAQEKTAVDLEEGHYVVLALADTGIGMTAELQSHIFEPFFTTKGVGEGAGLGLATVYGIVKQHNGAIFVDSEPGRGSVFRIFLRAAERDETDTVPSSLKSTDKRKLGKRVLVVEDEDMIRQLLHKALTRIGAAVDQALNFTQAIQLLKQNSWEYDLVICDLGLPDGRGSDLLAQVRLNSSRTRLMLISGYLDEPDIREDLYCSIRKPFKIKQLTEKALDLLGG